MRGFQPKQGTTQKPPNYPTPSPKDLNATKSANMTGQILYICDRRKCAICRDECRHTNDITHAEHFKKIGGVVMEQER